MWSMVSQKKLPVNVVKPEGGAEEIKAMMENFRFNPPRVRLVVLLSKTLKL